MGGRNSGVSRKPKRARREFRRGALARLDQRSRDYRALFELVQRLQADQAMEAHEMPLTLQAVTERTAFVLAKVATMEADALLGKSFDWIKYESAVKLLTRLADRLGYVRRAKPTRRLADLLAEPVEAQP